MTTLKNQARLRPTRPMPGTAFQTFTTANPRTLEQAVHQAAGEVQEQLLKPLTPGDTQALVQTRALLSLMSFCFARQIYGSADLSDIARRDTVIGGGGAEGFPEAQIVRRFREDNQAAVQSCLVAALRFLVGQKISLGALTKVSDAQLAEEANRRISMAALLDRMELDGEEMAHPPVELSYLFANRSAGGH